LEPQSRERIGGLAGLRDGHEQGVARDERIAIAVLACDFHRARQPANLLDEVAGDGTRVIARTARDDVHILRAPQYFAGSGAECGLE